MAIGQKPWERSITDPDWRNPYPAGTPEHSKLASIHETARRLQAQRDALDREFDEELRARLGPPVKPYFSSTPWGRTKGDDE